MTGLFVTVFGKYISTFYIVINMFYNKHTGLNFHPAASGKV